MLTSFFDFLTENSLLILLRGIDLKRETLVKAHENRAIARKASDTRRFCREKQFSRRAFTSLTLRSLRDMADFSRSLLLVCLYICLIQHLCSEMHLVPNLCTLYKTDLVVILI